MASRTDAVVGRAVRSAATAHASDRELLARFAAGDEGSFAALVARHGGMVLGVCRRVLPTVQDAEDATQAVFLVLARKASAGRWQPSIANWLYTTARRIAIAASRSARRRTKRETRPVPPPSPSALDQMSGREAFAALDAELDRLPLVYREPLVLCHLQGLTRDEAATRLGVPLATLKSRLERGRKKLAAALAARGCALAALLLAVTVTPSAGASSPRLVESILAAVGGTPPASVAALAQGVTVNGFLTRMRWVMLAAVGVTAVGFGLAATLAADPPKTADKMEKPKADTKAEPKKADEVKERTVTGKVVDPDGKPVQAELHLFWNRSWAEGRVVSGKSESLGKTNADGTFKVTVPLKSPGASLVAKADGFGVAFMMPATNTPADPTLKLVKDVPIKARIVDGAGKPVAGATVAVETIQTFAGESATAFLDSLPKRTYFREHPVSPTGWLLHPEGGPFRATTGKDGQFELSGLGGERLVHLMVRATGREDAEVYVVTRAGLDTKPLNEVTLSLQPKTGEKLTWDFNPILSAPDFTLSLAAEKPVRGRVTDEKTGKPRAGVRVVLESNNGVTRTGQQATTDADGRYELHGAKKLPTYTVSVPVDIEAGYLPAQSTAADTVGHEPVVADIACQRGVIVTGTVRDQATGKPVSGTRFRTHVLTGNTFAADYPSLGKYATLPDGIARPDGTYRLLVIPGPVLLTCGEGEYGLRTKYGPPKPDPDYPNAFTKARDGGGFEYFSVTGGQGMVDGNWCKVIDAKDTDAVVKLDIDLEPATKKLVKVETADGTPAMNVRATGFTVYPWHYAEAVGDSDRIPVFSLKPKEKRLVVARSPEKKQVGAAEVDETDPAPVLKLGAGGTAKGRVLDGDGKPVAGLTVKLYFARREVGEIYGQLNENRKAVTDADGKFEFDELLPGYDFRFLFSRGLKQYGPEYRKAPTFQIGKHGEVKDLGDLKMGPAKEEE